MDDPRTFFDHIPFWTFVRSKLVTGNWTVEGLHLDGRYVARTGHDLNETILACAAYAISSAAQWPHRTEIMPYTLTSEDKDGAKQTKQFRSLSEAIHEAACSRSPEIKEESSGTVIRGQAIRDMHEIVTKGQMNA